jgi:hypothetical protein
VSAQAAGAEEAWVPAAEAVAESAPGEAAAGAWVPAEEAVGESAPAVQAVAEEETAGMPSHRA